MAASVTCPAHRALQGDQGKDPETKEGWVITVGPVPFQESL